MTTTLIDFIAVELKQILDEAAVDLRRGKPRKKFSDPMKTHLCGLGDR